VCVCVRDVYILYVSDNIPVVCTRNSHGVVCGGGW